jgi:hypothetical protein
MANYVGKHGHEKTLYCSVSCARKDNAKDIHPIHPEEYSTEKFGALCPMCESEYENH